MNADLPTASEVQTSELTFRWIDGYYSGVLSGFATRQGKLCYFEIWDDATDEWKYTLHLLSDVEALTATREHEAFKAENEKYKDLPAEEGLRIAGAIGDRISAEIAAGTWQPPITYRNNPIVGWFKFRALSQEDFPE